MKRTYLFNLSFLLAVIFLLSSCEEEEYAIPTTKDALQNDVLKRSLGPNLVGQPIEFAYAMAIPKTRGRLATAQVEASIAGATGTMLENRSFYTNNSGVDVGVIVGSASVNEGNTTRVTFTADTTASTLRYFYVVPEAARGQSVSFKFTATSTNGETVTYNMGPYAISKMDIKLKQTVSDANAMYISIEDMAVYNATQAAANPGKIDLVYLYRTTPASFAHSLVAPATEAQYLPGITLPAGVNRNTKIIKAWNIRDAQLERDRASNVYIDDRDFQELDVTNAPNFAINMRAESGAWVETADGKYRAYIYINAVNNTAKTAQISIKRYAL